MENFQRLGFEIKQTFIVFPIAEENEESSKNPISSQGSFAKVP